MECVVWYVVRNLENGDLHVAQKTDTSKETVTYGASDWIVAPADRKPQGGACFHWNKNDDKQERKYPGWAIWGNGSITQPENRLYILDLPSKTIVNPAGILLPQQMIQLPIVDSVYDRGLDEYHNIAVAIDVKQTISNKEFVKEILVVNMFTAEVVDKFKIDGTGEHILSPFPQNPNGLSIIQQEIFEKFKNKSLSAFKDQIIGLIEKSDLAFAEIRVLDAIQRFASSSLKAASAIDDKTLRIVGWEELCADLVNADAEIKKDKGKPCKLASFAVFDRTGGGADERLAIGRTFYASFTKNIYGEIWPEWQDVHVTRDQDYSKHPVWIAGLEQIAAIERRKTRLNVVSEDETRQLDIDHLLSGLLLLIKYHRLFDRTIEERGLPWAVVVQVRDGSTPRAMDADIYEHGLSAKRFLDASLVSPEFSREEVERILAKRKADEQALDKQELIDMISQIRENYRIVRLFPFYRIFSHRNFSKFVDFGLQACCAGQNLPEKGVSWRMSKRKFETFLKLFVEKRGNNVAEILDPSHTDRFHEKWLAKMRANNFTFTQHAGMSLFEITLSHAIIKGGPIVQYRWENLGPYVQ
jgi:hypothetical protein